MVQEARCLGMTVLTRRNQSLTPSTRLACLARRSSWPAVFLSLNGAPSRSRWSASAPWAPFLPSVEYLAAARRLQHFGKRC